MLGGITEAGHMIPKGLLETEPRQGSMVPRQAYLQSLLKSFWNRCAWHVGYTLQISGLDNGCVYWAVRGVE